MSELAIGTKVYKTSGYNFPGEIVAIFKTKAGATRYVVEATIDPYKGMLHIYSEHQLAPSKDQG